MKNSDSQTKKEPIKSDSDLLNDKKFLGKDKKLKAQIKSAIFFKKKTEKHLKIQRFLENQKGGSYYFFFCIFIKKTSLFVDI